RGAYLINFATLFSGDDLVELDKTNNCLTNIWMCGDVNCDGKVTMSDVRNVFNRYFDPGYELNCCCGGGG
ncbi:hypothetical protein C5S29_09560, partial [ANME-1 cluster archaeon GoMg3.2]|nr:hypothetical protein [ANME-1 cluster archaeon GoMg3.2]